MWVTIGKYLMSNYKTWLPAFIILLLVLYHFGYVYSLKSDIKEREGYVEYQRLLIKDYEHNKTIAEVQIASLEFDKNNLKTAINNTNDAIDRLKVNEQALVDEVEKWKNKKPEVVVKYVNEVIKSKKKDEVTCEEYQEANKAIGRLKYEDL
jgi:hypothetical protein|nr:MAG TPA: hypothetical protein [Caudoviricetes sp.]